MAPSVKLMGKGSVGVGMGMWKTLSSLPEGPWKQSVSQNHGKALGR